MSNIDKTFLGRVHALRDVSLEIAEGEKVVFIGPSGSGKSTLLRIINGLETPDRGEIEVFGIDLTRGGRNVDLVRQKVGMVFQHFNLFPQMTASQNCTLALRLVRRMRAAEARKVACDMLGSVGLAEKEDEWPGRLSGGQKQRVAIARALCLEPEVMLFDEPTSALDPEMVGEVLDTMRRLARSGTTMLIATHEMGFAREVADRVVFMDAGQIVEVGPPQQIFGNPQTTRAQDFIQKIL